MNYIDTTNKSALLYTVSAIPRVKEICKPLQD